MGIEAVILLCILTGAAGFIATRVWETLRVSRGEKACGGCGCNKQRASGKA